MIKDFVFVEPTQQYKNWRRTNPPKKLTDEQKQLMDDEIRSKIIDELDVTGDFDIAEFMLFGLPPI